MNLLDAVADAGVVVRRVGNTKGGEYAGPCPRCGGTDRFRVWPGDKGGRGSYWCRDTGNGCGAWGDLVQFLVGFRGYEYKDAFQAAGRERPVDYRPAGQQPSGTIDRPAFKPRVHEAPVETWRKRAKAFADKSHQELLENKTVLHYLAGRGIDLQAVQGFRLGWFGGENGKNCLFRSRESWGLSTIFKDNGRKRVLWIPRGIVIPCFKGGEIYRLRIRRPKTDLKTKKDSKYIVIPGSGAEVMGHNPDHQAFVVVEAELDAMMIARRAGSLVGTVGLGSASNKPGAVAFPVLQRALRILVALDYDKAGKAASKWWLNTFESARRWPVRMGKDPGDAFERGEDIKEWIRAGLPPALTLDVNYGYRIPEGMAPMDELKMLPQKYPVKIQAEPERAKILFDPGFKNRGIRQRIHDLFEGDDEVHWYLRMYHPDSVIDGSNCHVVGAVA
ncbi:MAG: alpha helicase [Desulfobacterales bacterium]|nr:alpha helicase [Desulfobacterales bacterium]